MAKRTEGPVELTLVATSHGGYVVTVRDGMQNNSREVLFAGTLDECLDFIGSRIAKHFDDHADKSSG